MLFIFITFWQLLLVYIFLILYISEIILVLSLFLTHFSSQNTLQILTCSDSFYDFTFSFSQIVFHCICLYYVLWEIINLVFELNFQVVILNQSLFFLPGVYSACLTKEQRIISWQETLLLFKVLLYSCLQITIIYFRGSRLLFLLSLFIESTAFSIK